MVTFNPVFKCCYFPDTVQRFMFFLLKMVNEAADILKGADMSSFNSLFILFRKKLISHFKPGDDGVINSRIQR
nr:hypothetical protein BgiMline_034113 [Biomphalaria glabrata]